MFGMTALRRQHRRMREEGCIPSCTAFPMAFPTATSLALGLVAALTALSPASARDLPKTVLQDPYGSSMWNDHQIHLLGDPAKIEFDDRVIVRAPVSAEDPFEVPVMVDASALEGVEEIILSVDFGPIPKILTYYPGKAEPRLAFRFKIDQATPVRASVRTSDGVWHIGSTYIDAAGGGCTAPAQAYASDDWEERLGQVRARSWPESGRVRLIVDHPMDSGLADGIPMFIVEDIALQTPEGETLSRLTLHEPVDEDPAFTLHLPQEHLTRDIQIYGRDNNGNEIEAVLPAPVVQ
ncbi:MAG: quinoprotein dehydrogenase-associated SoxYZ-like carrier [Pseudomonadota bacterium]